jgi:hypothetical protein
MPRPCTSGFTCEAELTLAPPRQANEPPEQQTSRDFHDREGFYTAQEQKPFAIMNRPLIGKPPR